MPVASIMVHKACESLEEGVVAARLRADALGAAAVAGLDEMYVSAERHALSAVRLLLRLLGKHRDNARVASQAGAGTWLVWLAGGGTTPARVMATEALLAWVSCACTFGRALLEKMLATAVSLRYCLRDLV